jgi:hypothetical protein
MASSADLALLVNLMAEGAEELRGRIEDHADAQEKGQQVAWDAAALHVTAARAALMEAAGALIPFRGERPGDWIQVLGGRRVWPLDLREDEIHYEDIARMLAAKPRFSGCTSRLDVKSRPIRFCSIAEHSLRVAFLARHMATRDGLSPREIESAWNHGCVHDSPEAYMADAPYPVKRFLLLWGLIEDKAHERILEYFFLPPPSTAVAALVKRADLIMRGVEAEKFFPAQDVSEWAPLAVSILPDEYEVACQQPRPIDKVYDIEHWEALMCVALADIRQRKVELEPLPARTHPTTGESAWKQELTRAFDEGHATEEEMRGEPPPHLRHMMLEDEGPSAQEGAQ